MTWGLLYGEWGEAVAAGWSAQHPLTSLNVSFPAHPGRATQHASLSVIGTLGREAEPNLFEGMVNF